MTASTANCWNWRSNTPSKSRLTAPAKGWAVPQAMASHQWSTASRCLASTMPSVTRRSSAGIAACCGNWIWKKAPICRWCVSSRSMATPWHSPTKTACWCERPPAVMAAGARRSPPTSAPSSQFRCVYRWRIRLPGWRCAEKHLFRTTPLPKSIRSGRPMRSRYLPTPAMPAPVPCVNSTPKSWLPAGSIFLATRCTCRMITP